MPVRLTRRGVNASRAVEAQPAQEEGQQQQVEAGADEEQGGHDAKHESGDEAEAKTDADSPAVQIQAQSSSLANAATTGTSLVNSKFILVSDHGQTSLVPASRAGHCRKLTMRGINAESGTSTPVVTRKRLVRIPIKRGRGRPRKDGSSQPRFEFAEEEEEEEDGSVMEEQDFDDADDGTPAIDADGGEADGEDDTAPPRMLVKVVVEGKEYVLENDQLQLEVDEAGEAKIDAKGRLLGQREFVFPVFQSDERPDPEAWYALSIDVARSAGGRDSFFFYRKNPLLIKLTCTDKEKVWLIANGRLPAHLRGRSVTMLAVRNVFKLYGGRVIKNGRQVTDDYFEKYAIQAGKIAGTPADIAADDETAIPQHRQQNSAPAMTRTSERRQREAEREREKFKRRADPFTYATTDLHGNPLFTTFGDSGEAPFERAKAWPTRRANMQRNELNEDNWMFEMAQSVRGMNREIMAGRRERLRAFGRPYESIEGTLDDEEVAKSTKQADQAQDVTMTSQGDDTITSDVTMTTVKAPSKRRAPNLPIGVYEPLTNLPHFSALTQSRWAMFERLHDRPVLNEEPAEERKIIETNGSAQHQTPLKREPSDGEGVSRKRLAVLGGAKVGAQAWGIASMEQRVELPPPSTTRNVRIPAADSLKEMDT